MNGQTAKRKAKERDGWECQFCGMGNGEHKKEYGRGIHAHHIVKQNDDGDDHPRNLITVCKNCHQILENTQADALSRIKNNHTNIIDPLDGMDLESVVLNVLHREKIDVEVVSETFGNKCNVYTNTEKAREAYEEWGSIIKRNTVSINESVANDLVNEVAEQVSAEIKDEQESQINEDYPDSCPVCGEEHTNVNAHILMTDGNGHGPARKYPTD